MAFDLASVLKDAASSSAVTGKETIEYIPLEKIDPDPQNFYSLSDIGALAESIELLGLQQPIRVRSGEDGHVTVVSGHRRRAAITMITDGGNEMFRDGVPCIREQREGSAALNELKLIYANSATRVLSSSEISKQAERVTELLYQLKEEGIEFPGRMREHVAQACSISQTKLARLHAIRENLHEDLLRHFDSGELSETAAYELQKLPEELQKAICKKAEKKKTFNIYADSAKNCSDALDEYRKPRTCEFSGSPCGHAAERFSRTANEYSWKGCAGNCCCNCYNMETCGSRCAYANAKRFDDKKKQEAEKLAIKKRAETQKEKNAEALRAEAQKLIRLAEAAGLKDTDYLESISKNVYQIRNFANGDFGKVDTSYTSSILPRYLDGMMRISKELNCTLDYLYGTGEEKNVSIPDTFFAKPGWKTGEPPFSGPYVCRVSLDGKPYGRSLRLDREDGRWMIPGASSEIDKDTDVTGWWPIPEM